MRSLFYLLKNIAYYPYWVLLNNRISILAKIRPNVVLRNVEIGSYVYVGERCNMGNAIIGNYSSIAPGAMIGGLEHNVNMVSTSLAISPHQHHPRTIIGYDTWIGANAVIRAGVKVGNGAILGAGSVLLSDMPDFAIYAGVPAKFVRHRFDDITRELIVKSNYWLFHKNIAREIVDEINKIRRGEDIVAR